MSAEEVLTAFRRDTPHLFLDAAFAVVAWCPLPLPFSDASDSLLICFALFAALYGRLWISSPMLAMMKQGGLSTRACVEPLITSF
jgi:hypothetical protein